MRNMSSEKLMELLTDKVVRRLCQMMNKEIERNPEDYYLGKNDCGCINNGVGMVTLGEEPYYDERKAYEVCKENLCESIRNRDIEEELHDLIVEDEDIREAFADWIKQNF